MSVHIKIWVKCPRISVERIRCFGLEFRTADLCTVRFLEQ